MRHLLTLLALAGCGALTGVSTKRARGGGHGYAGLAMQNDRISGFVGVGGRHLPEIADKAPIEPMISQRRSATGDLIKPSAMGRFAVGGLQIRGFGSLAIDDGFVIEGTGGIEYTLNPVDPDAHHNGPSSVAVAVGLTTLDVERSLALTIDLIVMPRERYRGSCWVHSFMENCW